MPCGWEGNLRGLSTYGLTAIDREMSTPAYALLWSMAHLPFYRGNVHVQL